MADLTPRTLARRAALLILGVIAVLASARAQTAQDVLERLRARYDAAVDAQVKFSQRTKFSVAQVEQHAAGTLEYKKEHKYRIELDDQTIVTDGDTVWSYSAPNHQVLIDRYTLDERTLSPERILTAAPRDFSATLLEREKLGKQDLFVLKLVPKGEQGTIRSMKLWVDDSEWLIRKVDIVDFSGTETTYTVSDILLDVGLKDSRFTFQVPEGTTVVDLR